MKSLKYFVIVFLFSLSLTISAQEFGIGQWRDHFPYKNCVGVEVTSNRAYAATKHALFYFQPSDNSINRLSKINGLSDIGIQQIAFCESSQTLVVAYTNTNVDLIKDGAVINISDIKRKQIIGNKSINNIYVDGNQAYLCCGFGIVVLDVARQEVKDTYYIGENATHVNVLDLTQNDTAFFAATDEGLYTANVNSSNLADFQYWRLEENVPYQDESYNLVEAFSDKIFLNKNNTGYNTDSLFYWDGAIWQKLEDEFPSDNHSIEAFDNKLYVSRNEDILVYQPNLSVDFKIWSPSENAIHASDAMPDADGNVWVADQRLGLLKTWNSGLNGEAYTLQSPDFSDVFAMDADGNDVWVVSGAYDIFMAPTYNRNGFSSFIDESWKSYNCNTGSCAWPELDVINDFVAVEVNPSDHNNVFFASWGGGIVEMQDGQIVNVFDETNSSLQGFTTDIFRIFAGDLQFDRAHNLWVLNPSVEDILSVKTNDDQWVAYNLGTLNSNISATKLFVDSFNQKWIIPKRNYSLIVFTENGTINDTSDDEIKNLNTSTGNGQLFASTINCMAQDKDDEMWFGTNEGIGVIYSPERVFRDGNFDMQQILVEWDGYVQNLLETENVTAISIDAANRKWVGTKASGVFLLSEDGSEQIHHFTTENSPLISNTIVDIGINDEGEVFIGTDEGLVAFKGAAAASTESDSDAYAYPNPVPPGYTGSIAIKNLLQDANVKITDITGNVVFETRALGGQAIWNGYNFSGEKAHTGVYLVYATNEDGSVSLVTKILFIN